MLNTYCCCSRHIGCAPPHNTIIEASGIYIYTILSMLYIEMISGTRIVIECTTPHSMSRNFVISHFANLLTLHFLYLFV